MDSDCPGIEVLLLKRMELNDPGLLLAAAADPADAALYLPFKTLVSTVSSTVFSEGEAHRLIEILSEKGGVVQDTWHTVWRRALQ